jgi:methylglyoxal synthase
MLGKGGEMMQSTIAMRRNKKIALIAHDNKKEELFEWAKFNCKLLAEHSLYATGATGQILKSRLGLNVTHLESGPLGGDQQIGARISEGQIDFVIFFSDPLEPQPHDADVKALLRIAVVWNIPVACNRASADFIISSPLMSTVYERKVPDYSKYRARLAVREVEDDEFVSLDDMPATRWSREWRSKPLPDTVSPWAHFSLRPGPGKS